MSGKRNRFWAFVLTLCILFGVLSAPASASAAPDVTVPSDAASGENVPVEHDGEFVAKPAEAQSTPPPVGEHSPDAAPEATAPPTATPPPLVEGQPAPYTIQIDVKNQIVSVYGLDSDGLYTVLVRQMLCSTGTRSTPTPLGKFAMPGGPRDRHKWAFFPEFNVYAKFTSRIYQGILFHSVLYKNSKTLISSSVRNLGRRASHGCIRLQVKDAEWIYYNCPPGTEVYVFDDAESNPELVKLLKADVTSTQ